MPADAMPDKWIPAWICQLESGRWIVVCNDKEAQAAYYKKREQVYAIHYARESAFHRNGDKFGPYTVYEPNSGPNNGLKTASAIAANLERTLSAEPG